MELRKATENDVKNIAENEKNSFSSPLSENEIKKISENELYTVLVLDDGGYIGHTVFYETGNTAEIISVAVNENFRNKGFGKILVNGIKEKIKSASKEILLDVRISNTAAIKLYESCGFEIIARRKNFYEKPVEDAYTMKFGKA